MKATKRLIESKISNLKIDLEAETKTPGEKAKDIFCDKWDRSSQGIELTILFIKNPIAKWILGLALLIGNSVQDNICPKETK